MDFESIHMIWSSNYQWGLSLTISLVTILVLVALKELLLRRLPWFTERFHINKEYPLLQVASNTHTFFLIILGFYVGSLFSDFPEEMAIWPSRIMLASLAIQAGLWGNELIFYFIRTSKAFDLGEDTLASGSISVINFVCKAVLWSIVIIFFLSNLGWDVTALITGLGVGGVAVALAVQNILGDLFASLSIMIDKPFKIGDLITVDTFKGYVEQVGLKTTRIRSMSGEQLIFANADLLNSRIQNYKRMRRRRVTFNIAIQMGTTADQLELIPQILSEIIDPLDKVAFERAHFVAIGDYSYTFEVVYFIDNPDTAFYLEVQEKINLAVLRRFKEAGIDIANGTAVVYYENKKE